VSLRIAALHSGEAARSLRYFADIFGAQCEWPSHHPRDRGEHEALASIQWSGGLGWILCFSLEN
jgi:hypothetical protein